MCDECCDVSNKEQSVVCIKWVDSKLQAHEEFMFLCDIKILLLLTGIQLLD